MIARVVAVLWITCGVQCTCASVRGCTCVRAETMTVFSFGVQPDVGEDARLRPFVGDELSHFDSQCQPD